MNTVEQEAIKKGQDISQQALEWRGKKKQKTKMRVLVLFTFTRDDKARKNDDVSGKLECANEILI